MISIKESISAETETVRQESVLSFSAAGLIMGDSISMIMKTADSSQCSSGASAERMMGNTHVETTRNGVIMLS